MKSIDHTSLTRAGTSSGSRIRSGNRFFTPTRQVQTQRAVHPQQHSLAPGLALRSEAVVQLVEAMPGVPDDVGGDGINGGCIILLYRPRSFTMSCASSRLRVGVRGFG